MWLSMSESGDSSPKAKARRRSAQVVLRRRARFLIADGSSGAGSVIKGRPVRRRAKLLRALAIRAGYRVFRVDSSDDSCTARIVGNDAMRIVGEATFTLEQATKAGLVRSGSPWTTHPGRMLWARASKRRRDRRLRNSEVALGMALDDELREDLEPVT